MEVGRRQEGNETRHGLKAHPTVLSCPQCDGAAVVTTINGEHCCQKSEPPFQKLSKDDLCEKRILHSYQAYEHALELGQLDPSVNTPAALMWTTTTDLLVHLPTFFPPLFTAITAQLRAIQAAAATSIKVLIHHNSLAWIRASAAASRHQSPVIAPLPNPDDNTHLYKSPSVKALIKQLLPSQQKPLYSYPARIAPSSRRCQRPPRCSMSAPVYGMQLLGYVLHWQTYVIPIPLLARRMTDEKHTVQP